MRFVLMIAAVLSTLVSTVLTRADVTISAAISLKAVLEKARPDLEKAAGEPVQFTFGASGTLAGQIRQGAPVDMFISADRANVDKLTNANLVDKSTAVVITRNTLVLIVPSEKSREGVVINKFEDLTGPSVKKIAVGEPKVVPAGAYAKETLTSLHLWERLQKAGTLVTAENVAQVLAYVERGEVDAGLVYSTDAKVGKGIRVVATADEKLHAPIEYVSAIISASSHRPAALAAQKALLATPIRNILQDAGFTLPPVPATNPG